MTFRVLFPEPLDELETAECRCHLAAMNREGVAASLMVGVGESYLAAFALALGAGELLAGLLTTIPLVLGATLQLASPWAIERLGSYRRWVVLAATAQAITFVPLALGAWSGQMSLWWLFGLVAIYWGAGLSTAPAWSTWAAGLVPERIRAPFFARRTRLGQFALMSGFLLAGFSLQAAGRFEHRLEMFAGLFAIAAVSRLASVGLLASHPEPTRRHRVALVWPWQWLGQSMRAGQGRLLAYLLLVQAAVQISGPFFTPFILKQLKFSYTQFAALTACAYLAKIVALPTFGRFAGRHGARRLLFVGGCAITPVAGLWLVSQNFAYLLLVQVISGVAWAGYELAVFLAFFESVDARERASLMTTYNFFHALATLAGSLVGGALLASCGRVPETYLTLFGLSSAARLTTLLVLVPALGSVAVASAAAAVVPFRRMAAERRAA